MELHPHRRILLAPRRRVEGCSWGLIVLVASAWSWGGMPAAHAGVGDLRLRAEADYTWDDNVTRARGADKLSDRFATLSVGATLPLQLTTRSRLLLSAALGGDHFFRNEGLSRAFLNFYGELQYRSSSDYAAPVYAVFVRQGTDWYHSDLRDGYRTSFGVSIKKPATDRVTLIGAAGYSLRNAESTVFHTREFFVRGNLDYVLSRRQTLYFGLEYKNGDSVSTVRNSPIYGSIAETQTIDDVFGPPRWAYRIDSHTGVLTLGWNFALTERQALDLSYRGAYSQPKNQPPSALTSEDVYYQDNQFMLSYLIRF